MTVPASDVPKAKDIYLCAFFGAIYAYFGTAILLTVTALFSEGEGAAMFFQFIVAAIVFFVPFVTATIFLVAPLGTLIAAGLFSWLPPSRWHGAVAGAMTSLTLLSPLSLFGADAVVTSNLNALLGIAGVVAVAALSGWYAQRQILRWPAPQ